MTPPSDLALQFQNPQIHDSWNSVYHRHPLQDRFNERMLDRLLRWLQVPPGGRILDAGCGAGHHTFRLARRGFHAVGVDISAPLIRRNQERAAQLGVSSAQFLCTGLEDLSALDMTFDAIHCRGVLMHIPRFEDALRELCRVLKPGGRIVLLENNHRSLEMLLLRIARRFRTNASTLLATAAGYEFHCSTEGEAPLTRVAKIAYLHDLLRRLGVRPLTTFAAEFWDINRFPGGLLQNLAIAFNRAYFTLRLPARLSMGNIIIAEKE